MTNGVKRGWTLLTLAVALLGLPGAVGAQSAPASTAAPAGAAAQPGSPEDISSQLGELNATLRSIQDLLERHLETRSLELLMKRGEGMSRQVEQLEGQLRQALAQRDSYEEQQRQLDNRNASLQMQIERGVMDADAAQLESFREQVSREMQRLSGELRRLNTEIVELESRLATKRGDLQEWQDFIDRRLGGL